MATAITFVNSFLLGLLATFSPCLFPVLPSFVALLTKSEDNVKNGILSSLLVILGIMTVFVITGVIYNSIIGTIAPNYLFFRTTQGIILIVLGLLLALGFSLNFNFLNKLNSMADSIIQRVDNKWAVPYLIGLLFTLLAAPCAVIVFVTVFVLITGETLLISVLIMVVFSLGAGVPFLLVGGVLPQFNEVLLDNKQELQKSLSVVAGVLIVAVGIFLTLDGLQLL